MAPHVIDLIKNNNIISEFVRANSSLLNQHSITNTEQLISLWKQEFNADLELPNRLVFKSDKDLTMFLLKWS